MSKFTEKLSSKKLRLLIAILLIGLAAAYFIKAYRQNNSDVTYKEVKVVRENIYVKILATGTVQPENRVEIKPPIPGRVEEVLIKEGQKVVKGQILAWMSSTERAALLDAARAKGAAEVKKWESIYPPTPILAPLDGTIILKNVEQGETFTSSDSLISMSDRLTVKAQVDETDISSISVGQEAEIILDAYSDQKIPAKVDKIAFDATTVNNVTTYIVDVLPITIPDFMRSGMTANVMFVADAKENVLLIPSEALKIKDGRSLVMVRNNSREIEKEVTTGITNGKQTEILSGLAEGDIILTAQIKLQEKGKNNSNPFNPMRAPRGR
jgi:macrolide-specific efflux system membrane fusion protein